MKNTSLWISCLLFKRWVWYKLNGLNSKKFKVMYLRVNKHFFWIVFKRWKKLLAVLINDWITDMMKLWKSEWNHFWKSVNHIDLPWVKWNQGPGDWTQNNGILMWQKHKNPNLIWDKERHWMQTYIKETAEQAGLLCLPCRILHSHLRASPKAGAQDTVEQHWGCA